MFQKITIWLLLLTASVAFPQKEIENLIIITIDGLRWQEVFYGMDRKVASKKKFNQADKQTIFNKYWDKDYQERRKKLMPFLWKTINEKGQLYGNRLYGNKVDVKNHVRISYAGYNEFFCGYADPAIHSNLYPDNPNVNILEFLNNQPVYNEKVAAFTAWHVFNRILNKDRCGFPVFAAFDNIGGNNPTPHEMLINNMLQNSYKPWGDGECLDVFTHYAAMEYLTTKKPKILYIAYGEADEWAHAKQYKNYLNAVNQTDKWIEELWNYVENTPEYKEKTMLFITVDHGRGNKNNWTRHGKHVSGSNEIWMALIAPGVPHKGEVKTESQLYLNQFSQTIANLLNLKYTAQHPIGESLINEIRNKN